MKTITYIVILLGLSSAIISQNLFCPPGSEWSYSFSFMTYNNTITHTENEKIIYVRDSIINSDTCKVLKHSRYFMSGNTNFNTKLTVLKQKADTVFYRNYTTQSTWQILYVFSALPGHTWKTFFVSPQSIVRTMTVTVDSVTTVQVNGFNLKQLRLTLSSNSAYSLYPSKLKVTERLGCNYFLFYNELNFYSYEGSDFLNEYLCYKDNSFGNKKFTSKSCDFSDPTGLVSSSGVENDIRIYPNPTNNKLVLDFENINTDCEIRLTNTLGQTVIYGKSNFRKTEELNLSALEKGVYFLQVFEKETLMATKKIIKE